MNKLYFDIYVKKLTKYFFFVFLITIIILPLFLSEPASENQWSSSFTLSSLGTNPDYALPYNYSISTLTYTLAIPYTPRSEIPINNKFHDNKPIKLLEFSAVFRSFPYSNLVYNQTVIYSTLTVAVGVFTANGDLIYIKIIHFTPENQSVSISSGYTIYLEKKINSNFEANFIPNYKADYFVFPTILATIYFDNGTNIQRDEWGFNFFHLTDDKNYVVEGGDIIKNYNLQNVPLNMEISSISNFPLIFDLILIETLVYSVLLVKHNRKLRKKS